MVHVQVEPVKRPNTEAEQTRDAEQLAQDSQKFNREMQAKLRELAALKKEKGASGLDIHAVAGMQADMAEASLREMCPDASPELIAQMREIIMYSAVSVDGIEAENKKDNQFQNSRKPNEYESLEQKMKVEEAKNLEEQRIIDTASRLQKMYQDYRVQNGLISVESNRLSQSISLNGPAPFMSLHSTREAQKPLAGNWELSLVA